MEAGKRFWMSCLTGMLATLAAEGNPVYRQRPAREVNAREGIGNTMAKIRAGKPVTVAYLGGSITAMNGWRNLTTAWLQETYPQTKFKEIHASIGGTGSDLGAFRVEHDALRFNPDLLFIEFATNDSGSAPETIWRNMEGIVRQTWKKNPATDIVFTYTITKSMTNDYCQGHCNRSASAMELLADHYGIPSVNFGPRVARLLQANQLLMDAKEIETAVPCQSPNHDREILARAHANGRILFSNDSVHPRPEGHALYLASITNAFTQMANSKPVDHAAKLAKPFVRDHLEAAKMVSITPEMLTGTWRKLTKRDKNFWATNRMDEIWFTETPGSALTFKFKGTKALLYDLLGPDGGQVLVTVDGKTDPTPHPRFDSYCTYYRLATLHLYNGADSNVIHTVKIVLDSKQPNRTSISFRLKDPAKELAHAPFQGTTFWPGKIMLVGELVK